MPELSDVHRGRLDGIVQQMVGNGESEDNIRTVVEDFKQKYSGSERFNPNRTEEPNEDFWTSVAHFPVHGLEQAVHGIQQLFTPGERMMGAHNVFAGGGKAAAPFALPAALIGAPAATIAGMAAGLPAQAVTPMVAESMGASPGAAQVAGDIAGMGVGGAAARGIQHLPSLPSVPRGAATWLLSKKLGIPRAAIDAAIEHFTPSGPPPPPPDTETPIPRGYYNERWTGDPNVKPPVPPSGTPPSAYRGGSGTTGPAEYGAPPPPKGPASSAAPATSEAPPSGIDPQVWETMPSKMKEGIWAARNQHVARQGTSQGASPEGGGPIPPPPGHVPEHYREHYTQQAEVGHSEALAKDTKIANYLKGQGKSSADVLKMTDAELVSLQNKLGYRAQSGSRSRTFDEFRKHLAAEMGLSPPPK